MLAEKTDGSLLPCDSRDNRQICYAFSSIPSHWSQHL